MKNNMKELKAEEMNQAAGGELMTRKTTQKSRKNFASALRRFAWGIYKELFLPEETLD